MLQRDCRPLSGIAKPPSQTLPPHEGEGLGLGVKIVYNSVWYYPDTQSAFKEFLTQIGIIGKTCIPAGSQISSAH